jgi:hypothetical protein
MSGHHQQNYFQVWTHARQPDSGTVIDILDGALGTAVL